MITITKAKQKDSLESEWRKLDIAHFGIPISQWTEKKFNFKAVEDGKIVGIVDGKVEAGTIFISTLMVVENARGKDLGTTLIKAAEAFGKKHGAHRTWLITGKHWSENQFYKKLGFQLVGDLVDFYLHTDCVVYTRKIE